MNTEKFHRLARRQRLRLILIVIILAACLCYGVGFYALSNAGARGLHPSAQRFTPTHIPASGPVRFAIPRLGVDVEAIAYEGGGFATWRSDAVNYYRELVPIGSVAILAHNNLIGSTFYDLRIGDRLVVSYQDGTQIEYSVTAKLTYKGLGGDNYQETQSGERYAWPAMTQHLYGTPGRLTLFTCLNWKGTADHDPLGPVWGRLAVFAEPIP